MVFVDGLSYQIKVESLTRWDILRWRRYMLLIINRYVEIECRANGGSFEAKLPRVAFVKFIKIDFAP